MSRSTPDLPVHHQLPEFTQTHVYRVSDAIQPSHPLSSPSPLSIGKNSKWQGDQELGPYPLFFSILIHFQSLAVNTIYVLLLLLLLLLSHFSRV